MTIGTEDGYWYSFNEKEKTYEIYKFNVQVDYGRADDIDCVMDWFGRFVEKDRARPTEGLA